MTHTESNYGIHPKSSHFPIWLFVHHFFLTGFLYAWATTASREILQLNSCRNSSSMSNDITGRFDVIFCKSLKGGTIEIILIDVWIRSHVGGYFMIVSLNRSIMLLSGLLFLTLVAFFAYSGVGNSRYIFWCIFYRKKLRERERERILQWHIPRKSDAPAKAIVLFSRKPLTILVGSYPAKIWKIFLFLRIRVTALWSLKTWRLGEIHGCFGFHKEIPPGEEGKIKVTFKTANRTGINKHNVTVTSNDQTNPNLQLEVVADLYQLLTVAQLDKWFAR